MRKTKVGRNTVKRRTNKKTNKRDSSSEEKPQRPKLQVKVQRRQEDSSSEEQERRPKKTTLKKSTKKKSNHVEKSPTPEEDNNDDSRPKKPTIKATGGNRSHSPEVKKSGKLVNFDHATWLDQWEKIYNNKEKDPKKKRAVLKELLEQIEETTDMICRGSDFVVQDNTQDEKPVDKV